MHTETSVLSPTSNPASLELKSEPLCHSDFNACDWSSVDEAFELSSNSSLEIQPTFKPIQTCIFKKASRKWLSANSQNFYSQTKNTLEISKDRISAGKVLQAFENYLSIVCMMYFGDPFSKSKQNVEVFRPGKRARAKQIAEPLSMLVSPLRAEHDFESWSPKQVAVFESSLCHFGKRFEVVERFLNYSKSQVEITKFYYMWKKTSHYKLWKEAVRDQVSSSV